MNFNEQSIDGLNTIYCDELFIGGVLLDTNIAGSAASSAAAAASTIFLANNHREEIKSRKAILFLFSVKPLKKTSCTRLQKTQSKPE